MSRPTSAMALVSLGGLLGLAWAAGLRGFMAQVTDESMVAWVGTFALVLLPGVATGALLGWAEYLRRTGGRPGWRWLALAPLLLTVAVFYDLATFLSSGIGGGATAVPLIGMTGGFAISGRGPRWARTLCGLIVLAVVPIWALTAPLIRPELAIFTARGAWVALYYWSFLAVLALGCSIPHRQVWRTDMPT